jgi:ABC-2 type transport system ATP-binding protein
MDVAARREFWASMHRLAADGRTVLFATHYLAEAEEFADRVVLLRSGRVVADGSVAAVRALAAGRVVSAVVPGADPAGLAALPGVTDVDAQGPRTRLVCADSDAALRALLAAYPAARDIEVAAHGLEDAFVALTAAEPVTQGA